MNTDQSSSSEASEPISKSYRASAFADAMPALAAPGATPERLAHLREHGFVIITDFVGNPMIPILRDADARMAWQLDPAVRETLPHAWMKTAWDRWAQTQKLGDSLEDRYADFDVRQIKAGNVVGWRSELERQAAAAGEAWKPSQTVGGADA